MEVLHVHAESIIGLDLLSENDAGIPGVYEVRVSPSRDIGEMAWAAVQAFEQQVHFDAPDDFTVRVIHPLTDVEMKPVKPASTEHVRFEFGEKVKWELPRTRLNLTLDISYHGRGVSAQWLINALKQAVEREILNGSLTGSTDAEIDSHALKVVEVPDEAPGLEPEHGSDSRRDYRMRQEHNSVWVTVDTGVVEIGRNADCIEVNIHPKNASPGALATASVSFSDLEDELCEEHEICIDVVQRRYAQKNPNGKPFALLSPMDRANQINLAASDISRAINALETVAKLQEV